VHYHLHLTWSIPFGNWLIICANLTIIILKFFFFIIVIGIITINILYFNMRFSHQREVIKEILYATNSHPTADWVFSKVRMSIPSISLGTVYRNLKQLDYLGVIKTIYDGPITRYDWNNEPHDHFKCKKCGALVDVALSDSSIKENIKDKFNFKVDDVEITLIGTCNKHLKINK